MNNIFDFTTFQGVLASLGFYILLLLIPLTVMALSMINVRGIMSYKNDKNLFDKLLEEKYGGLVDCLRYGFFASILLVAYLVYLFFIDNQSFASKLEVIGKIVVFLVTFIVLFLGPLISFIVNIKQWKRFDTLKRITEVLGVLFSIVYFVKPLMMLFFRNEYFAFGGIILFLIIFPINFYRFFRLSLKKVLLYVGKFFKNGRQK